MDLNLGNSKLGRERALLKITAVTLLISHEEPVLTFTEITDYDGLEVTEKMTCYTDGRGETNRTRLRFIVIKSKTRWNNSQLVTMTSRDSMLSSSGPQHFSSTVKRELSSDGQTLTITTSMRGPEDTRVVKQVFNRAA